MPKLRAIYIIIGIAIIVSGCAQKANPKMSKNIKKTVKKIKNNGFK
jgi:PBP1b-binding outer membrane lipoprotein LpoB